MPMAKRFNAIWRPCGAALVLAALGLAGCGPQGGQSAREESQNNLKQIGMGILQFHDTYQRLPPAEGEAAPGLPRGISWRVHILPFIEQDTLYKAYVAVGAGNPAAQTDDFWRTPELLNAKILTYQPKFARPKAPNETFYRAFIGPGTAFDPDPASRARLARKILVVEAGESAPWTKPEELSYAPDKPLPPLGGLFPDGFNAVFGDGTVRFIPKTTDEKTIRGMITGTGE